MTLYRWTSELLREYGLGDIVVAASSVGEARAKTAAYFDKWLVEDRDKTLAYDEDQLRELALKRIRFMYDIASEPEVLEDGCIFIGGRE